MIKNIIIMLLASSFAIVNCSESSTASTQPITGKRSFVLVGNSAANLIKVGSQAQAAAAIAILAKASTIQVKPMTQESSEMQKTPAGKKFKFGGCIVSEETLKNIKRVKTLAGINRKLNQSKIRIRSYAIPKPKQGILELLQAAQSESPAKKS